MAGELPSRLGAGLQPVGRNGGQNVAACLRLPLCVFDFPASISTYNIFNMLFMTSEAISAKFAGRR